MKHALTHRAGRLIVAALTLLVLAIAVGEATGWPVLRGVLQSTMSDAAGVPVTLQPPFRVRLLWRPGLLVKQ